MRVILRVAALVVLLGAAHHVAAQTQPAPSAAGARILLVPRRMISGERATIAVLDMNGRLTPGVTIQFSNGDKVTTDTTGRALFVAPLTPGALYASIAGRPGRVATAILAAPAETSAPRIDLAPRIASVVDRFEVIGTGFCGDADKNQVTINGQPALVLASSPGALIILPPPPPPTGLAEVSVACGKQEAAHFKIIFVTLKLEADTSPLQPGQKRTLKVSVGGTQEKIPLEARNLAPEIAELEGGNPARVSSSGGETNTTDFHVAGKKHGSFLISIRLVPVMTKPLL